MAMFYFCTDDVGATSFMGPLSSWNVSSAKGEVNFKFYLILVNFNLAWLVTTLLTSDSEIFMLPYNLKKEKENKSSNILFPGPPQVILKVSN